MLTRVAEHDDLLERKKELQCLHRISGYEIKATADGIHEFLQQTVTVIKESMQFPRICEVEIQLHGYANTGDIVVQTPNFGNRRWTLQAPLTTCKSNWNDSQNSMKEGIVEDESFCPSSPHSPLQIDIDHPSFGSPFQTFSSRKQAERVLGIVTIAYVRPSSGEESPVNVDKPWLSEERTLLRSICLQISLVLHSFNSDALLASMLPPSIARSLCETGAVDAQEHTCTILFTDIVGFTNLASCSSPKAVFDMLNDLYTKFDALVLERDANLYKMQKQRQFEKIWIARRPSLFLRCIPKH